MADKKKTQKTAKNLQEAGTTAAGGRTQQTANNLQEPDTTEIKSAAAQQDNGELLAGIAGPEEAAPQLFSAAGSEPVMGVQRSLADVAAPELLMALAPSPARPDWMVTRYPVSMEEFSQLKQDAEVPDPVTAALALVDETTPEQDMEVEAAILEAPEGEVIGAAQGAAAPGAAAPGTIASFDGIPQTAFIPSDDTIAVGPNDVMVAVNATMAVYSRTGSLKFRWPLANMFSSALSAAGANASVFDPKVAYDHYARRWIVVAVARVASPPATWILIGVSQGPDPNGAYWTWALNAALNGNTPTNNWADYPTLGFDTQAIYIACNMFLFGGGFQYTKLRILNKAELYGGGVGAGHAVRWYDMWNLRNPDSSLAFTVQPAVHFTGTGGNPPAYMVNALFPRGNSLTLWTLTNPIAFWTGGAPGLTNASVPCIEYDLPPGGRQPGTSVRIATNDTRLLNAVYQNAGGVQRLWTTHTAKHTWQGEAEARSVAQWYEINIPTKTVAQQNKYGASGKYYFFPAIQTDLARNAYLVVGRSGETEFASIRQTGRRVGDPPNSLQSSTLVQAGASSNTSQRWGDYFGICRDGEGGNMVWMYAQYAATGGSWATRVCAARF
ncbi:MAG TPA: hypothetical protein VGE45_17100 [Chloroflexia bacterium]|jgi:hypothetical protein